jgi:histidinol-phosphate phosphatase family protein
MSLALKQVREMDRYGTVILDKDHKVRRFEEKATIKSGWINGGLYIISADFAESFPSGEVFSFEAFLTNQVNSGKFLGFLSDGYFIDIGIPEDYETAQNTLPLIADRSFEGWTLFLDRDGVINKRTPNDYVKSMNEWVYCDGALNAISKFSKIFDQIIVVTNQQGVPLGKMSSYTLELIHQNLKDDVRKHGGYIDAIYASLDLKEKTDNSRKPNTHMAQWAKRDFPEIDFNKSIMVGDSASDIEFGQALGMRTTSVEGKIEDDAAIKALQPNWSCKDLAHFADIFTKPSEIISQVEAGTPLE